MSDSTTRDPTNYKTCTQCGETKPATTEYFAPDKTRLGGIRRCCKKCRAEYQRAWREANKERIAARDRAYREINRERKIERDRAYREANRESIVERRRGRRELDRAYYEANRERYAEYQRAWREANPEGARAKVRNYTARKRNAEGNHTAEDIQAQYKAQRGRCYYAACGHSKLDDNYHVDHAVPLSRGGSNGPENLVIACPSCNQAKGDRLPSEFSQGGRLL